MGDYWDSYALSDRKDEADNGVDSGKGGFGGGYAPPILPVQDDDPAPGDLFGRVQRIGRADSLLDEFSSALEGIRARPGEPGRGRHNLSEEILGGLMYPFGNRFGNEHARSVFKASPAAFTYLSGEEAPPLPWGTYKGRGRDMSAARLAREQGRDLGSVTSRLQELESAQSCLPGGLPGNGKAQSSPLEPLALAGQALSGVVGAIGDFFSPGEAHAETSADTGDVASEAQVEAKPAEAAGNTATAPVPYQYRDDELIEGSYPDDAPLSSAAASSSVPSAKQMMHNSEVIQPEAQEKTYHDFTDDERDILMKAAYKHDGKPWEYNGDGENGKGIDCSRLVGKALKDIGYDIGSPSSANLPKTETGRIRLEQVETPKKGDIAWYPNHVGFYDPNGEASGKPIYSATTSGGVRYASPKDFGGNPVFYRIKILDSVK